jgi:hypothetical protein
LLHRTRLSVYQHALAVMRCNPRSADPWRSLHRATRDMTL